MRQRLFLNGSRKNGLVVTVSTRALKVARRNSLSGLLHQNGTRPHLIATSSRLPSCSTIVSAGSVGQAIERVNLLPRVVASEPSAHLGNIDPQRPSLCHRAQFDPRPSRCLWTRG